MCSPRAIDVLMFRNRSLRTNLPHTAMSTKKAAKSKGTAMAEKTRAAANRLSPEERQKYLAKAMQLIYSDDAKARADRR